VRTGKVLTALVVSADGAGGVDDSALAASDHMRTSTSEPGNICDDGMALLNNAILQKSALR
jgi:hypothetical protein